MVSFRFDNAGARKFGRITQENVGKPFAIVLDDKVISAPQHPRADPRRLGHHLRQLHGRERQRARRCCCAPAPCRHRSTVIEERSVGAELGADSIRAGTIASIVACVLVIGLMLVYYGIFGADRRRRAGASTSC